MRKQPGQVRFNLTPAIKRTLHMVNSGYVWMQGDVASGWTFAIEKGKATPRMLWVLIGAHMIERGPQITGRYRMQLTTAGLAVLGERQHDSARAVQRNSLRFPRTAKPVRGAAR